MDSLEERVRQRLREEMSAKRLSQRDLANLLEWSQSRVAKLLTGRVSMSVDDLNGLCFAVSLSPTEAVRDRGLEFSAELTPTELRVLQNLRKLPQAQKDAIITLLGATATNLPDRHARPLKKTTVKRHA